MKKIINIKSSKNNYQIIVDNNFIFKEITKECKKSKNIFIIVDTKLYHSIKKIEKFKNVNIIKLSGGEKIKSFKYYIKIVSKLLSLKIDRSSLIIAIGGGTIGDLAGYIASTILRGIDFILIPTTLLSQVDSSIGGKNGINSIYGKNLIGTFYPPIKVFIDTKILKSLPIREIRSGYAEILKHSLINDVIFYQWLLKNGDKVIDLYEDYIKYAIIKSIKIKSFFVEKDEKENLINSNSRAMLNFGHTFAHALETINGYKNYLNHGEAVAIGMVFAAKISIKKKLISSIEYKKLISHLKDIGLPYYDKNIKKEKFYEFMLSDKKNTNNKINLILLKKIGKAYFERGLRKEDIKSLLI